jgi:two-component system chemotaxis sensor kinase CheA
MRRFKVVTTSSDDDLLDLFTFHVAARAGAPGAARPGLRLPRRRARRAARSAAPADAGYGFFDDAPGAPGSTRSRRAAAPAGPGRGRRTGRTAPGAPAPAARPEPARPPPRPRPSTLRVSVEKVDQLINLVGELVITQAMLAQNSKTLDQRCTSSWPPAWPTWSATPATCRKR